MANDVQQLELHDMLDGSSTIIDTSKTYSGSLSSVTSLESPSIALPLDPNYTSEPRGNLVTTCGGTEGTSDA